MKIKKRSGVIKKRSSRGAEPSETILQKALKAHQLGDLDSAEVGYRNLLTQYPGHPDAMHLLGLVMRVRGDHLQAEELIRRAIGLNDQIAAYHCHHGVVLSELSRLEDSLQAHEEALRLNPDYVEAHNNRGNVLNSLGRLEDALLAYNEALRLKPDYAKAHNNRGSALKSIGRLEDALLAYDQALRLNPDYVEAHNNRGSALMELGRQKDALLAYDQALRLNPDYAEAHNNRGSALMELGRQEDALLAYDQALRLNPDYAGAHNNRGNALKDLGYLMQALLAYSQAIKLKPDFTEAHSNRGNCLKDLGFLKDALFSYDQALALRPDYAEAHSNRLFLKNLMKESSASELLADARCFDQCLERTLPTLKHLKKPFTGHKLRVGFVSGDLRQHPVGYFIQGLFRHLDRSRTELTVYSTDRREDAITAQLKSQVDDWCPIFGLSDLDAALRIRADVVDILIDLSGHTALNRLGVFAQRAAPVQLTWLGYFGTTGVAEMDYLLGDPYVTPTGEEHHFSERIWRLPDSYLCFSAPEDAPTVSIPPVSDDGVTFGSFNNLVKMSDAVVALWAQVLRAVANSCLFLKTKQLADPSVVAAVRERFATHGIGPERLRLEGPVPRTDLLAAYSQVDIALDPFPYPGGTTSCEALWMGTPVLTKRGDRFLSHVGESIAHNAGLSDWIAEDEEDYIAKAVAFSTDSQALAELRAGLRDQVMKSPLFDAPRFAKHFEEALWGIRDAWRARSTT